MPVFSEYYRRELRRLKDLGREFSQEHPILAPLLSGPSADADVERLLEGVAFLTAGIRRKLDDELPEILHTLMQMICPHYLRPVPSATIIAFAPKDNLNERFTVPASTHIDSVPVNDTVCRFRTCRAVEVSPLQLKGAALAERSLRGHQVDLLEIRLDFSFIAMTLGEWDAERLRLHIAGDYEETADLYLLLTRYLKEIRIEAPGAAYTPPPESLSPAGFDPDAALLPYPTNVFPSFRLIQEYFLFPEKFMFFDLDLSQWKNRGSGTAFSVTFVCNLPPFEVPKVNTDRFVLFATPAVNLFTRDAEPVLIEHQESEVPIRPGGMAPGTFQVFSVDGVSGFVSGTAEKRYFLPFTGFNPQRDASPVYQTVFRPSTRDGQIDVLLSVAYPESEPLPVAETISVALTCTNDTLPDLLQRGDISRPTSDTPELVTYKNITPPTASQRPPIEGDLLWYLLAHLSLNYLSIASTESLKTLLTFYLIPGGRDKPREIANRKRIDGIDAVTVSPQERLFGGAIYRGQSIFIKTRSDHFSGIGDMALLGSILDRFLGTCASINTYTVLTLEDVLTGERIPWLPRLGTRPLI